MKRVAVLVFLFFLLYKTIDSVPVTLYISSKKADRAAVETVAGEWQSKLQQLKKTKDIPPVNGRIDSIWKGVPGYNGLVIDEAETLKKMKQAGVWNEALLVYKEVEPEIQLEQLEPAEVYRGNTQKPMVSLMINVAWGNEYLPAILETLAKEKVRATFFLDGSWTKKYPDEAKKIVEAGHEIGSHAYSHPNMSKLSLTRIEQEITKTSTVIQEATGIVPSLFAPPSGDYDQRVVDMAARYQLRTILWTADTIDWRKPSSEQWFRNVSPKIGNGVLILMHPTESTANTLPRLIQYIKGKKLLLGTVSETISSKRVPAIE